jgi:hypothetical protein
MIVAGQRNQGRLVRTARSCPWSSNVASAQFRTGVSSVWLGHAHACRFIKVKLDRSCAHPDSVRHDSCRHENGVLFLQVFYHASSDEQP